MDESLLEVKEFTGVGYLPLIDFGTWRVAFLRYIDELIPRNINRVERHVETDEVFVLLEGQAILYMGTGDEVLEELVPIVMEPCKLYNVRQNAWHCCVVSHNGTILLVENRNTSLANTEYCALDEDQKRVLISAALLEQPGEWENT